MKRNVEFSKFHLEQSLPREKQVIKVGALALQLTTKKCSPQHYNDVRNGMFSNRDKKDVFMYTSCSDLFILKVIFEC